MTISQNQTTLGPIGDSIFKDLTDFNLNIFNWFRVKQNNILYNGIFLLGTLAAYCKKITSCITEYCYLEHLLLIVK
jgi:hypothetical protein